MSRSVRGRTGRAAVSLLAAAGLVLGSSAPALAAPGVSPASSESTAAPGDVIGPIDKTVSTPAVPPLPDVVLLADTTGSMGAALSDVKSSLTSIISSVSSAQPDAQFAVASYRDVFDGAELFRVRQNLTDDSTALQNAVNGMTAGGGGDWPEAQLHALTQLASGAISFRPDSTRIVVWFGDAYGHDPVLGSTLASTTSALQSAGIRLIAVSVGNFQPLDFTGQATHLTSATGGVLLNAADGSDVSQQIISGLNNLPTTVSWQLVDCHPALAVALSPSQQTVTSGDTASFTETITVAEDAPQGETLTCTVRFLLDGRAAGTAFDQSISVAVRDVSAPTGSCEAGANPSGNGTASTNNGFYRLLASDNVDSSPDLFVVDTADPSVVFGPYASGTTIKLVQAPGATQSASPGSGGVDWHITLKGDALLQAVDDSGNGADVATCTGPPNK
jgi:hypothetical protein